MSSKRDVSDEQNERHKKILDRLLKEDGNKFCVDCGMRSPTWASVNLGVFMCMTCSGIHRSLGVHISQVRSTKLDTWLPKQVEFIQRMGNIKGNKYWEADLPPGYRRPPGVAPNPELQKFIREKYCEAKFAAKDVPAPSIQNYLSHPYIIADSVPEPEVQKPSVNAKPLVNIPLPTKTLQPPSAVQAAVVSASAVTQKPASAAVDFDLLCMDSAPATAPSAAAAVPTDDPFGDFSAAPVINSATAVNDPFSSISAGTAFPVPAEPEVKAQAPAPVAVPATVTKPAPAKPSDPFATLVGSDLITNMQLVSLQPDSAKAGSAAPFKAAAPPSKTAADILKLYDTPQANAYTDPFLGPVNDVPSSQFGSGQFGSGQFGSGQLGSGQLGQTIPAVGGFYGGAGFQPNGFQAGNMPVQNTYPQYAGVPNPQMGNMFAAPGLQQQVPMYNQPVYGGQFAPASAGGASGNPQFNSFF